MTEREAMARALELAWQGWGRVYPNPLVGAVVLAGDTVVGEGYHGEFGGPHAEAAALAQAGDRARGATLIVTLEPCTHQGKQPPCADAVLAAGVTRVVVAAADPNPLASGGVARLRAAGLAVELGLMGEAAAAQNAAFLHRFTKSYRPYIALKLATSVDARIADSERRSKWLSGPEARAYVQWLRAGFDAVGVGSATARDDDPSLTVRGTLAPRIPPARVIFAPSLWITPELTLVRTARQVRTMVVTSGAVVDTAPARLLAAAGVELLPADTLDAGMLALRSAGITSLLVEGGGRLAGALLQEALVDRLYWIQSPLWLGERGVPAFRGVGSPPLDAVERWHPVERKVLGQDTLLVLDRACSPGS